MKAKLFHNMTTDELKAKLNELKEELFYLRFKNTTGQQNNPMQIAATKKDIARVMTILHQRENDLTGAPKASK